VNIFRFFAKILRKIYIIGVDTCVATHSFAIGAFLNTEHCKEDDPINLFSCYKFLVRCLEVTPLPEISCSSLALLYFFS
jgi:hypothetical protein